jgi:hypothetical protein
VNSSKTTFLSWFSPSSRTVYHDEQIWTLIGPFPTSTANTDQAVFVKKIIW